MPASVRSSIMTTHRPSDEEFRQLPPTTPLTETVAHQGHADVRPEPLPPLGPDGMDSDGD